MEIITKSLCQPEDRLDFLPRHVGAKFLSYEQAIYRMMDKHCQGYTGGFWDYYTLSNGGFFMAYDQPDRGFRVEQPLNYYEGVMSAEAASIGVNLYVQNTFAWQVDPERFSDAYHALRDFAAQHPEGGEILRFID